MAGESPILQLGILKKEPRKRRKQKRKKNPANRVQHNQEAPKLHETQENQELKHDNNSDKNIRAYDSIHKDASNRKFDSMKTTHDPEMLLPPSVVVPDISGLPNGKQGYLSPRKVALRRHEHKREPLPEFLSEAKKNMKPTSSNNQLSAGPDATGSLNGGFVFSKQNMEGKSSLITISLAQILVYHDTNGNNASAKVTSGALLARGILEVFQLHNGDVTYMSCGESFVYPLLPKLNILRTSELTFVLPLANPRRYWKILVHAADPKLISTFENVLQNVVQYTNVVSNSSQQESERSWDQLTAHENIQSDGELKNPLLSSFFDEVPPSPSSISASPPPETAHISPIDLNLRVNSELCHNPIHNSAINNANHDVRNQETYAVRNQHSSHHRDEYGIETHTGYVVHDNRKLIDEKADSSSMDSLLDEYEETLSVTRSMSIYETSSNIPSLPFAALKLPSMHHHTEVRESPSKYNSDFVSVDYDWNQFKRTAGRFSRKNLNNPSHGERSRKSSTSDLYTSVSNWMEPGKSANNVTMPHSKSLRSLASRQSLVVPNQVFDIYRESSISASQTNLHREKGEKKHNYKQLQSNIHPLLDHNSSKNTPDQASIQVKRSLQAKVTGSTAESRQDLFTKKKNLSMKNLPRNDGLTPSEVYDLIRNRDNMIKPKSSGIRGFFGW